jgi:hypothetical protein
MDTAGVRFLGTVGGGFNVWFTSSFGTTSIPYGRDFGVQQAPVQMDIAAYLEYMQTAAQSGDETTDGAQPRSAHHALYL